MPARPVVRSVPDKLSVVEVYGSKFLLEWLDRDMLALAAALQLREAGTSPVPPSGG